MKLTWILWKAAGTTAISIVACLMLSGVQAAPPDFRWAQRVGGDKREYGTGVAIDSAGNSHVIGRFTSANVSIGGHTLTNGGLFVATYNAVGDVVWARQINTTIDLDQIGPTSQAECNIAVDGLGNTYVGGWFSRFGSITFEGVTLTNSTGVDADLFLAKYDNSGSLVWARKAGTDGTANTIRIVALTADATGNCFVTGDYFDAPSMGLTNLTDLLGFYTAKFGGDGNLVWARTMAFGYPWPYRSIAVDNSSGYFVSGAFIDETLTFGGVTLTNFGQPDFFTVRYDSAGNLLWAKRSGSAGDDYPTGIGVDAKGDCYLHGYASYTASFDDCVVTNGGYCLAKYDQNGNVLWCRTTSTNAGVQRYATDALGNSYLFGIFYDVATFDGITLTNLGSAGYPPTEHPLNFLVKLNPEGDTLWAKKFAGGDNEYDWTVKGGMAVDVAGNCSVTGFIRITNAIFDGFTFSPMGEDEDFFVARLDADPPRLDVSRNGNSLALSWPTNQPNFVLESTSVLNQTNSWSLVTNPVTAIGFHNFVTNPITGGSRFFRLRKW